MTTYDAWIESEPPEDKDALIDALEREVEWLRGQIEAAEGSGSCCGCDVCPWCKCRNSLPVDGDGNEVLGAGVSKAHGGCEMFTSGGKVRSKFL